jgi:hypothetical protein
MGLRFRITASGVYTATRTVHTVLRHFGQAQGESALCLDVGPTYYMSRHANLAMELARVLRLIFRVCLFLQA